MQLNANLNTKLFLYSNFNVKKPLLFEYKTMKNISLSS